MLAMLGVASLVVIVQLYDFARSATQAGSASGSTQTMYGRIFSDCIADQGIVAGDKSGENLCSKVATDAVAKRPADFLRDYAFKQCIASPMASIRNNAQYMSSDQLQSAIKNITDACLTSSTALANDQLRSTNEQIFVQCIDQLVRPYYSSDRTGTILDKVATCAQAAHK